MTYAVTTPTHLHTSKCALRDLRTKIEVEHGQPAVFFRVSVPRSEVLRPTECWTAMGY